MLNNQKKLEGDDDLYLVRWADRSEGDVHGLTTLIKLINQYDAFKTNGISNNERPISAKTTTTTAKVPSSPARPTTTTTTAPPATPSITTSATSQPPNLSDDEVFDRAMFLIDAVVAHSQNRVGSLTKKNSKLKKKSEKLKRELEKTTKALVKSNEREKKRQKSQERENEELERLREKVESQSMQIKGLCKIINPQEESI